MSKQQQSCQLLCFDIVASVERVLLGCGKNTKPLSCDGITSVTRSTGEYHVNYHYVTKYQYITWLAVRRCCLGTRGKQSKVMEMRRLMSSNCLHTDSRQMGVWPVRNAPHKTFWALAPRMSSRNSK